MVDRDLRLAARNSKAMLVAQYGKFAKVLGWADLPCRFLELQEEAMRLEKHEEIKAE